MNKELAELYRQSIYEVLADEQEFCLSIGLLVAECRRWMERNSWAQFAVLTAWNPYSESYSEAQNAAVQQRMIAEMFGFKLYRARGSSPDRSWYEDSVAAMGMSLDTARSIAYRYKQNAFVFVDFERGVRLIATDPDLQHLFEAVQ